MKTQNQIGIFCSIRCRSFHRHLIKRQLLFTFASDILKAYWIESQIFQRQGVHIMSGAGTVQNIGLKHRVKPDSLEFYVVIKQNRPVVFQVLTNLWQGWIF